MPVTESVSQKSLEKDFAARSDFHAHRSSAIFPVRLRADTDAWLVFLDYWSVKNGQKDVTAVVRVYSRDGTLACRRDYPAPALHNRISIRELLGGGDFDGMFEIEFLSGNNLRFAFPGVLVFYRAGAAFSAVHSAGRVKNAEEPYGDDWSRETNWACKFEPGISPFFHLFNGPRRGGLGRVAVELFGADGRLRATREIETGLEASFASRIFFLDEIFAGERLERDCFAAVRVPNAHFYPRLVAGNLHRADELLEATHTFPWTAIADYVRDPGGKRWLAFLTVPQPPELEVDLVSFPTNAPAEVACEVLPGGRSLSWRSGGDGAPLFRFRPEPSEENVVLGFKSGSLPSRLNSSHQYRVRGANSPYSTDIASGAKPWVYPPKRSHWGHGLLGGGFETILMAQQVSHAPGQTASNKGGLTLYGAKGELGKLGFEVPADGCRFLRLSELLPGEAPAEADAVSWFLKTERPDLEIFWVAYAPDGRICGDHSF